VCLLIGDKDGDAAALLEAGVDGCEVEPVGFLL
jgi:hypothetical protein